MLGTRTQYSELIGEVLPHMRNNCLFTLLEVGIGVKGLQVADQDIVTHFIVNLCRKDVLFNSFVHPIQEHTYATERCKTVMY